MPSPPEAGEEEEVGVGWNLPAFDPLDYDLDGSGSDYGDVSTSIIQGDNPRMVSCGIHKAPNCTACPEGNGEYWCSGDCVWKDDQCEEADHLVSLDVAEERAGACSIEE